MANENIELYIYDRDLNFLGVIDTYTSLRWRRKYFEAGEFELHLTVSKYNMALFDKDNIILREQSKEAGLVIDIEIIEEEETTKLIIKGRFLSYLLYRRIVKKRINFTGTITDGMRKLLNEMTPFSKLVIEDTDIESEKIIFQCTYKNVYNYENKLALASNIGFRIVPDIKNKKILFQNYIGKNRTVEQKENSFYVFSEEYSNIEKADYLTNSNSLCNYVLVGGEGEGDSRFLVEIDNTEGLHDFDIVEKFVDAKSESQGDLTDSEYTEVLKEKGNEYIQAISKSISYDVYAKDYKEKWDLGDIVTVKKESWNISENLRITEVEEVIENNTITITPTFGTPLPDTFIDDEK